MPKEGGIGQFPDLKEGFARNKGWCFWRGVGGLIHQCTLCLKMHFENNKSVFLLKEIQHASKLLELIWTDSFLLNLAEYYFLKNIHSVEDSQALSNSMQSGFICFPKSYMYVREGLAIHYMHYCKHYMWLWREGQNLWFFTYLGRSQKALVFNQEISLNRILHHFDLVFDVDMLPSAIFVEFF